MQTIEHLRAVGRPMTALAALVAMGCSDVGTSSGTPLEPPTASLSAGASELHKTLATIRGATAAFHDVDAALAAGYRATTQCESRAGEGAMGYHYANPLLMGTRGRRGTPPLVWGDDRVIDFERPEVLLYEPQGDGSVRLVAVEYVVFADAWHAVNAEPPTLAGIPFDFANGATAHGFEPHYELHVWLWRHNPNGMFAKWNPKVSC